MGKKWQKIDPAEVSGGAVNRRERKHCPHVDVVGVWGDAINHAPGYRRNFCRDCGRYLDGPVTISVDRQESILRRAEGEATE